MKTYREANDTYNSDCMKADIKYHEECKQAWERKEDAYTKAVEKRKKTKVDPTTIP